MVLKHSRNGASRGKGRHASAHCKVWVPQADLCVLKLTCCLQVSPDLAAGCGLSCWLAKGAVAALLLLLRVVSCF